VALIGFLHQGPLMKGTTFNIIMNLKSQLYVNFLFSSETIIFVPKINQFFNLKKIFYRHLEPTAPRRPHHSPPTKNVPGHG